MDFGAFDLIGIPSQYFSLLVTLFTGLILMSIPRASKHRFQVLAWVLVCQDLALVSPLAWFMSLMMLLVAIYVNAASGIAQ